MIGRVAFFYFGFPVERHPRQTEPGERRGRLRQAALFLGEADRGVSAVAFKLPKSNISQIRLWLFLREPERRVMDWVGEAGKKEED